MIVKDLVSFIFFLIVNIKNEKGKKKLMKLRDLEKRLKWHKLKLTRFNINNI